MWKMEESGKRDRLDVRIDEDKKKMVGVWSLLLGNIIINVRAS